MYATPETLKDLCIDYICDNIEKLYMAGEKSETDLQPSEPEYMFIDSNVYLPMEVSEMLLTKLSVRNKLNDEILSLFSHKNVYLRNVILPKTKNLTTKGLRTLKKHKIKKLKVYGLDCTVNELVGSLGEWTTQHLESLCVSNSSFISDSYDLKFCVAVSLSKLKNLCSLDVSNTEFSTNNLIAVVEDLPHLESLDISNTKVDTLLPLGKKKNQLKKLSVYNLKEATMHLIAFSPLKGMTSLTHLDLSSEKYSHPFENFSCDTPWLQFLTDPNWLPNLVSLDISGSDNVGPRIMQDFLTTHKKLKFLGLMHMDDCGLAMFTVPTHPLYNPDLVVTGVVTQEQLLTGLKRYTKRPTYIQKCLYHLFKWTEKYNCPKVDIIQLILNVMNCLSDSFPVQMAATACLYNLTKSDLALNIHPSVLAKVVEATLDAMERFPNHNQLQKNTLLTLCSDRILQDVKMDKFRCAKLVLDSLHYFNDIVMNRMSVAICSILAAKISTSETSQLGSNPRYMAKLLSIVYEKLSTRTIDVTMKFTLSALWNLTDESPTTCKVFIDEGGLTLYMNILNTFIDNSTVETKVLGLVNNIAEVPHLRNMLFSNDIIPTLRRLLRSEQIDVSYFAAGIIAHLACEPSWETFTVNSKSEVLEELRYTVKHWVPPEGEMVAYRSFQPFIGLLKSTNTPQVQLWAAWAILHVCTKNSKKYCAMLSKENGIEILQKIALDKSVDHEVCELCYSILDLMNEFRKVSNPVQPTDSF
ncbi:PREDICTED: protein zyg-11 homolog B-like [Diuraphis noxia]|uniref:protein zyg-11 homolog B-like n=1 Tax=Diuraphis noxia TaxID=143948 RepID=UPI0007635F0A|nr:PREDICTED: protein zyg-11 homolog B-like [Diuraphis noxia]XP_015380159.1 PREDICTED: protein zyg-11 homolog B-like [Diuraphis noxia]XP_015380160.1 PREDICTED: protein zyg-11 homolog B-like [Diuraphis noxia]